MSNWDLAKRVRRVCRHCGADFLTIRSNRVFCEKECAYQALLKRLRTPQHRAAERQRTRGNRTWVVRRPATLPIRVDVNLPADLAEWVQGVSKDRSTSVSEVLRAAVQYAQNGSTELLPLRMHPSPIARHNRTHLSTMQGVFLDDLVATEGKTRSQVMRRLLWRLKAAIDPPVSG